MDQPKRRSAQQARHKGLRFAFGGADAVLMASITHFENYTIRQMKEYLRDRGIAMNL